MVAKQNESEWMSSWNATINDIPRETYVHYLDTVIREIGCEAAAQLLEVGTSSMRRYMARKNIPLIDPHELERAYIAYRSMQFDMNNEDFALYRRVKRDAEKELLRATVDRQSGVM